MAASRFRFDSFLLDMADRRLCRGDAPVPLNARYFDALALLVWEQGRLVSKDRFLAEVWQGVPVTDEALTQCIRTLRRALGDDATRPRFIETVPKHGYRFIAQVAPIEEEGDGPPSIALPTPARGQASPWRRFWLTAGAGSAGGGVAGLVGGLCYGFAGMSQSIEPPMGALSVLLVLATLTMVLALAGAAGVAFGIAGAALITGSPARWSVAGGAAGGMAVGGIVKLLGLDAFRLLLGTSPGDITGAAEGALLGGGVGLGLWLAVRGAAAAPLARGVALGSLAGGGAGMLIPALGGRLMGGSLDLLARRFPDAHFRVDGIGALFGEDGLGRMGQFVSAGLEGALFGGCLVGAMLVSYRRWG